MGLFAFLKMLVEGPVRVADPTLDDLISSIMDADVARISSIVAAGVDINGVHDRGQTPLIWAICTLNSDFDLVACVVTLGADVCQSESWKPHDYPLHFAVESGREDVVRLLIESGADTNAQNDHGNTALSSAVFRAGREGVCPLVKLLVESGANPDLENANGVSAFDLAGKTGKRQVELYLKEACKGS